MVRSAAVLSAAPQALQNPWPAGFVAEQLGQVTVLLSGSPQFPQNRASEPFSCPQAAQSMADPY